MSRGPANRDDGASASEPGVDGVGGRGPHRQTAVSAAVADQTRRAAMVADGIVELEAELGERSGMTAMAIRAGYKTVRKLRPRIVEDNLDRLLPRFAPVLDGHYETGLASGDLEGHFVGNAAAIAESLLATTDARAAEASNKVAVKAYEKLRPRAKDNVVDGMPRVVRLLERHVANPDQTDGA